MEPRLVYALQQSLNALQLGSIYALIALGYTMVYGVLRFINFAHSDVLMLGPLTIDLTAQTVRLNGAVLELTAFEYRLLEMLVQQRPAIVKKQALSDYLYPHGEDRNSNVLEVLVGRLRRKLDPEGSLGPIETVRGRGYRFTLE